MRTHEMHHIAETGVASHWLYKEDEKTLSELQHKTTSWLQSLLELQNASGDSAEFLEHVKIDLFPGEVYVFSPKGKIFSMPRGSTSVDFAYAVHRRRQPLRRLPHQCGADAAAYRTAQRRPGRDHHGRPCKPQSGVAVLCTHRQGAGADPPLPEERATRGIHRTWRAAAQPGATPHGLTLGQISTFAWDRFLRDRGVRNRKEIFTDIGLGKRLPVIVARRLAEAQDMETGRPDVVKPKPAGAILIRGSEGIAVQLAKCCQPIPGDPIIGIIRKGQGLEVHVHDCPAIQRLRGERGRWVDVEWEHADGRHFDVSIRVLTHDARGVLAKVANAIAENNANIQQVRMDAEQVPYSSLQFTLQVTDRIHLARLLKGIRRIPEVVRIMRTRAMAPLAERAGR